MGGACAAGGDGAVVQVGSGTQGVLASVCTGGRGSTRLEWCTQEIVFPGLHPSVRRRPARWGTEAMRQLGGPDCTRTWKHTGPTLRLPSPGKHEENRPISSTCFPRAHVRDLLFSQSRAHLSVAGGKRPQDLCEAGTTALLTRGHKYTGREASRASSQ